MDPLARLLEILGLLQGSPVWTATALAERTGTTPRTVRRDISRLRELGYRIAAAPGPDGGYRLDRGRAVPPLLLTADEAVALVIGVRSAGPAGVAGMHEAADGALTKLATVLPPAAWARVSDLDAATVRPERLSPSPVDAAALALLATAVRQTRRVRFGYTAADGTASRRRADPSALVHTGPRWFLVAHDVDRAAWRTFRVDRIIAAEEVGPAALPAEVPEPLGLVQRGTALAAYRWQARILLDLPLDVARMRVPPTIGLLDEADDDRSLLRLGGEELRPIATFLVGLTCDFEVLDPPELVEELHALGRWLVGR